jgi:hypothetical protein
MDRAARYTFLVCVADQMRQVLDHNPVGDPTANRIVPACLDFACRSGVRNLAQDLQARTFVHPVMTNERLESSPAANGDGRGLARTADRCGFSRVRLVRLGPA